MSERIKRIKLDGPCEICDEPETMEMVQCDECDDWYHFHCAGVGPEIVNFDWLCSDCERRHEVCTKTAQISEKPKKNFLKSSKSIEMDTKKQLTELATKLEAHHKQIDGFSKVMDDFKIEIGCQSVQIVEQAQTLEAQRKQIDDASKCLGELTTEIGRKNVQIAEQAAVLESQRKQIDDFSKNVSDLKAKIDCKNDQIVEQGATLETQGKQIEELFNRDIERTKNLKIACAKEMEDVVDVKKSDADADADVLETFLNLMCLEEAKLLNFNKELRKPKLMLALQNQFCVFGGDLKSFIANMLNRIICKDLQGEISWSGKRTTKRIAMTELSGIVDLIHFSCIKKFKDYDTASGEIIIQKFLQNA